MLALLSLVPVGLGLFLLAFGVPGRPLLAPTPRNLAVVGAVSVATGPVALLALGFLGWLVVIALVVCAAVLATGLRPGRSEALPE